MTRKGPPHAIIAVRVGGVDVPVEIRPDCPHEGEVEWRLDFNGRAWPVTIILRACNERVLLHEMLHALVGTLDANPLPPSHPAHEEMVRHITRGLWDAGWRLAHEEAA